MKLFPDLDLRGLLTSTITSPPFLPKIGKTNFLINHYQKNHHNQQKKPPITILPHKHPLLFLTPPLVPTLNNPLQFMSPSPDCKKPPPSHLESLKNPTPDPPNKNDHMIIPKIYKSKPSFLTQTQSNNPLSILTTILQKIENLEKREANITLPTDLTALIT
ncbi:hypothetical protein O181_019689 [Austropuccinia psidii MF-1]|uniref:Uncharacterized protein n=1 Tax=Austropuccinia psidii MF-1 TaxID=1389203 RepID=A0A9Q3CA12_9BASI|nr:hypothetical protein [Austropuccinia psidii MF-1]